MIEVGKGNLLEADVDALVNTVNCRGFMGKGIALQFKKKFSKNFKAYEKACHAGDVTPGHMLVFDNGDLFNRKIIINFPTKRHWRNKSQIEDIESGLKALVREVHQRQIRSIAIPPLGCGLGELNWNDVRPRIEEAFADLNDVRVIIYEPMEASDAAKIPVRTRRPKMTPARALFIKLIEIYSSLNHGPTLLEVQKLAYFLQAVGEPLRLNYEAGPYGPYAMNVNKVLEVMECHFICGYGDRQKPKAKIDLLLGAIDESNEFLRGKRESVAHLDAVSKLIEGFETPFDLELLASVHWVVTRENAVGEEGAVAKVHAWNERKKRFSRRQIGIAYETLQNKGWLLENA